MNLSELREKTIEFLTPIIIILLVLWGSIALIGKAYFWDISELSLQFAEWSTQLVKVEVQARIIYFDADLFGFYYPVHITLPRTYEQNCSEKCVFSRLPPGDALITVLSGPSPLRTRILILPDTSGSLDFRPPFEILPVSDTDGILYQTLSETEKNLLTGTIEVSSRTQGFVLLRRGRENSIYDISSQQLILLPFESRLVQIAKGDEEGTYLIWMDGGVILWDRYGRNPVKDITELTYGGYVMSWAANETTITRENGKQIISGYWSPLFSGEKMYITDWQEVREIK